MNKRENSYQACVPSLTAVREWLQYVCFLIIYSIIESHLGKQKIVNTASQGSPGKQVYTYLKCASKSSCDLSEKKGVSCYVLRAPDTLLMAQNVAHPPTDNSFGTHTHTWKRFNPALIPA